jgi:hypothetical protein
VFDQARELREIGASIALQPCALRCLEKLGLGEEVERLAYRQGEHPLVGAFSTGIGAPRDSPCDLRVDADESNSSGIGALIGVQVHRHWRTSETHSRSNRIKWPGFTACIYTNSLYRTSPPSASTSTSGSRMSDPVNAVTA